MECQVLESAGGFGCGGELVEGVLSELGVDRGVVARDPRDALGWFQSPGHLQGRCERPSGPGIQRVDVLQEAEVA